ncbi:MAG TPA: hypothetical protein PLJ47_10085 [Candidatus Hydrogenedentes bacterium]|nr:hypothetical protein [Candidatus Hydrogenedentota bacterium]
MKLESRRELLRMTPNLLAYGPHEVAIIHEHMLRDPKRGKDIPLRCYTPNGGGPFPVIIFSHGAGDSNATSPLLLRHWASHGYVVIAPTHLFGTRPLIERSLLRLREELMRPREMGPAAWAERTGDIAAIMDNLDLLGQEVPKLTGIIDPNRMAVAGHSFGAYTVTLTGGAELTDPTTGKRTSFSDPRPRAILMISGPGPDHTGLTDNSWSNVTRPLMVFTGSRDPGYVFGCGPMWRAAPYTLSPEGDKYLVYIRGAHHLSYIGPVIDLPLRDPARRGPFALFIRHLARRTAKLLPAIDQTGIFDYTRIASVAFWNAYLKDDSAARAYLTSHVLDVYSARNVRTSSK